MRRANRKDAVHESIVAELRESGIVVYDMPEPGDILCWHRDVWMPMELKSSHDAPLTPAQEKRAKPRRMFVKRRDGSQGWIDVPACPIPIVTTAAEGRALFGIV